MGPPDSGRGLCFQAADAGCSHSVTCPSYLPAVPGIVSPPPNSVSSLGRVLLTVWNSPRLHGPYPVIPTPKPNATKCPHSSSQEDTDWSRLVMYLPWGVGTLFLHHEYVFLSGILGRSCRPTQADAHRVAGPTYLGPFICSWIAQL